MASTIHDERPSTSSYVPSESTSTAVTPTTTTSTTKSSPSTRPSSASSMASTAYAQPPPQYWQGPYYPLPPPLPPPPPPPRNSMGHWRPCPPSNNGNGFNNNNRAAFNPLWTPPPPPPQPQQPRNFLPQAPFYMQANAPIQWSTYGYSYTAQPISPHPNIIPPPPWTPSPQSQTLKSPAIIESQKSSSQPPLQQPSGPNECWNNAVVAWEQRTLIHNKIGLIVNDRYRIVQNIDSGSYGTIFVAEDMKNNNVRVAVKFDAASKDDHLKYEYEVYKSALYDDGCVKIEGFPRVHWFGNQFGHNVLVMELLGPPISSLFNFCERKFGVQTILLLGEQMIRRIKHLHQRGFIHRDLKLENFLMGLGDKDSICYLIDFGLARRYRYREGRQLKHIPFRKGRSFVGTAKYASLNSHKNAELSRRDDVESLGYVLIELINGSLPWKKLKVRNAYSTKHQMYIKIRNMKEQASWSDICPSMAEWMSYCKKLAFVDEPDYDLLLGILQKIPEIIKSHVKDISESMQDLCIDDPRCSQCRQKDSIKSGKVKEENSYSDDNERTPSICNENFGRERKLSKSASMSVVNTLNPQNSLSTAIPAAKPYADSVSDSKTAPLPQNHLEDDTASIASTCRKCRSRRQKYLDDRCAATGAKYSWQVWREATPELKFQYENRFPWTLPQYKIQDNRLQQTHQQPPPMYPHPPPPPLQTNNYLPIQHSQQQQPQQQLQHQQLHHHHQFNNYKKYGIQFPQNFVMR